MKIAGSLLAQIEDGTYKPGDALPHLGELAESFTVSRSTAGHAMQVLADEGRVQFVPGRGYYVCEPS
jgi:GntR family transcriptional regulator